MPRVEICLTPDLYACRNTVGRNHTAVVVDVLRATSTLSFIIAKHPQPIKIAQNIEELRLLKEQGYKVASERDGLQSDFADYGNSPLAFINGKAEIQDKIAFSTTNGTGTLFLVKDAARVVLGSFLNMNAVAQAVADFEMDVVIVCAGWKGRFSLEDAFFAGALTKMLVDQYSFEANTDAAIAAMTIWQSAQKDYPACITRSEHYQRLCGLGHQESADFCLQQNIINVVSAFENGSVCKLEVGVDGICENACPITPQYDDKNEI